ncbi:jg16868 [Pararge aegeria aegeria]|uniref:Jg16868 protein n=1 Tax=Pararge aegeria aegeria TaxID=348720 RepID=A0A8S4SIZ8_9NEOP|nr:jg16868 [Pararge aegeria aegeria]
MTADAYEYRYRSRFLTSRRGLQCSGFPLPSAPDILGVIYSSKAAAASSIQFPGREYGYPATDRSPEPRLLSSREHHEQGAGSLQAMYTFLVQPTAPVIQARSADISNRVHRIRPMVLLRPWRLSADTPTCTFDTPVILPRDESPL